MASNDNIQRIGVQTVVEGINAFRRDMQSYTKALGTSSTNTTQFTKSSDKLNSSLKGLVKSQGSAIPGFNIFSGLLPEMSVGALAATAAVIGLSVAVVGLATKGLEAFGEFQKGTNEVFTLLPDISNSAMSQMRADLQRLDNQFGITSKESIPGLYQAISAGVPQDNVFEFLTVAQKAAKGGVTDLRTAIDGITTVVNSYGASTISATRASDLMFTAVRLGKTTFGELSASLSQVIPIAANAGIGFETITAAVATLTAQGVPTSTAVTQIRSAIVALQRPTSEASVFFKQISGKTFPEFLASGGTVQQAFDKIAASAAKSNIPMAALFTRIEGANAILGLTGQNSARFTDALDQMGASTGALDAAFARMNQGLIPAIQRLQAVGTTIFEQIGGLIEPFITPFVEIASALGRVLSSVLGGVQALTTFIAGPSISAFQFLGSVVVGALDILGGFFNIVTNVIIWLTGLRDSLLGGILAPIVNIFNQVKTTFGQLLTIINAYIPEFFKGAGHIAGAIASGLLAGANQFVFPVIIDIATFIADFLSGFSPPRRGPLSNIDEGAANVMRAWTGGFVGAFSINPVQQIATDINTQLGNIGSLGAAQVENRLRGLDLAVRPFTEQLKVAKDQFEAIQAFADPALRSIDRQISRAEEALRMGDVAAQQTILNLNRQKEAIQQRVDAQQELTDNATIQLALARASQQEERTLLEIQKTRVGEVVKGTQKTAKLQQTTKPSAAPKAKAGVSGIGASAGEISDFSTTVEDNLTPALDVASLIGEGFMEGLDPDVLAQFNSNTALLGTQLDRIGESDPVQGLLGLFGGLGEGLDTNLIQPFKEGIQNIIGLFTGETQTDFGTITDVLSGLPGKIGELLVDLGGSLTTYLVTPFLETISSIIAPLTDSLNPGSIAFAISSLVPNITTWLTNLPSTLLSLLQDPFNNAINLITGLFDPSVEGTLPNLLSLFFTGTGEGTLGFILQAGLNLFTSLPPGVQRALQSIGLIMWNTFAIPIIEAINWVIDRFNDFFAQVTQVSTNLSDLLNNIGISFTPINVHLDHLSTTPPGFLSNTPQFPAGHVSLEQAREGGLFSGGALRTHKDEIVAAAQPFGVLSQRFVRAMDVMSNSMMTGFSGVQPVTQSTSTSNVVNDNRTTNINANMQNGLSAIDIATQLALQDILR